jgi:lipopolysaccharide export system permease protein
MGSIARYIFRSTTTAFFVVLVSLTGLIWVTQALRSIDLLTNRGQSIFVFVSITGLVIPVLVLVITPVALFIAIAHTLNKLSNDSEIIVMNAAGMSPWALFRTFIPVILLASLIVATVATYFAPKGTRLLREWLTQVNTDVVTHIVQPGRFVNIVTGVTIHIAAREPNGQLRGVFLDDRRNPAEHVTMVADRGDLVDNQGAYLVLQNGTVQREEAGKRDPTMVAFDRYAVDLAQFARTISASSHSVRDRYLWELLSPDSKDKDRSSEYRAELLDRLIAPFYPLAFAVIVFAYLGGPRTTRQKRVAALAAAIAVIFAVRLIGFASTVLGVNMPAFLFLQYAVVAATIVGGIYVIKRGASLDAPVFITSRLSKLTERMSRRFATG